MKKNICILFIILLLQNLAFAASPVEIGTITPERCAQPPAVSVHNISSIVEIMSVKADIQYYSDPNAIIDNPVEGVSLFSDTASEATDDPVYRLSLGGYLTKIGKYHVCVYATDMNGKGSEKICTIITNPSCGNLNGDNFLDLADAILALRVSAGIDVSVSSSGDLNGDGKIGMEEVIYVLQSVAGLR